VLYLDSDIVAEESIEELWAQSFEDHIALAVPERAVSCPENGIAEWERLGLMAEAPYFNSGVMIIRLDRWREADISGAALRYLTNPENRFCYPGDQEALNAVLAGRWGALAPRWNATHLLYSDTERPKMEAMLGTSLAAAQEDPALIHFTSDRKPWMPGCAHPLQGRFFHYLRRSGWFGTGRYEAWRVRLALRDGVEWAKTMSRPLRHKIGLRHRASA
jgi:lipopolysaccharide biosynthesis glycosyltransferase